MSARTYGTVSCGTEERLPLLHRTIRLPVPLWRAVKLRGQREGKAVRWVVDEALDTELTGLVRRLRRLGLRDEITADKLVRMPLDDNAIGRLNLARRETGLPAVLLLRLCLMTHVARDNR